MLLAFREKFAEADSANLRAIEIGEKALGPEHPDLSVWLNNRAVLLSAQVKAVIMFWEITVGRGEWK